jgi:hypothetical protein
MASRTLRLLIYRSVLTMLVATLVSPTSQTIRGMMLMKTDSTALLIGEKCSVLTAEDLGYSGKALEMKVPNYHAPGEMSSIITSRL